MEKHAVARLIGAPPGYVGYEEGGVLTEAVRRRPYQVVLFDEVEKAHGDVFNVLLQVLDDGRLTDGQGRTVDFTNTIIILTSNLGSQYLASLGEDEPAEKVEPQVMEVVRAHFRPEFLNRLDEIILFHRLSQGHMGPIVDIQVARLQKLLEDRKIRLELTDAARAWLGRVGYDPVYGARPLKRAVQKYLQDPLADKILAGEVADGSVVRVDEGDGQLVLTPAGRAARGRLATRPPAAPLLRCPAWKPKDWQPLLREASRLHAAGRAQDAIAAYQRLLAVNPDLPDSWFNLGWLQKQSRDFEAALKSYQRALDVGVARPEEVHVNRAAIYSEYLRQPEQTEAELLAALNRNPGYVPALLNLGNLREDLGEREGAREAYAKVLEIEPGECACAGSASDAVAGSRAGRRAGRRASAARSPDAKQRASSGPGWVSRLPRCLMPPGSMTRLSPRLRLPTRPAAPRPARRKLRPDRDGAFCRPIDRNVCRGGSGRQRGDAPVFHLRDVSLRLDARRADPRPVTARSSPAASST